MEKSYNECYICGIVLNEPEHYLTINGEDFFRTLVSVKRKSGAVDVVPVRVSQRADGFPNMKQGEYLYIEGTVRSFDNKQNEKMHLEIYLFAEYIYPVDEKDTDGYVINSFEFDGTICKPPIGRVLIGNGDMKYIADVLVAVSGTKRSFYLPCIVFGRNGRYLSNLKVGTKLKLRGRFQSRNYIAEADPSNEVKTAYEIAVSAYELNE